MNKMIKSDKDVALEFVGKVRGYLSEAADSFFKIGYELHKAQQGRQFKALGYDSLEDLADDAFGFSKTQTYDLIKVYNACKKLYAPEYMREEYKSYSFSQLAAMETGRYAGASTMILRVKPTDSVRAIKKYVSFWNKYTERHSVNPRLTLQEWLEQEEERQELESAEQLTLGELVEEAEEQDETPGEIFRTSELQELAEEESEIEEAEEIEEQEDIADLEEQDEQENVSRETETETQRYTFENRAQIRAFYGDYANWGNFMFLALWLKCYKYDFRNGMSVFAVESTSCKDIANMTADRKNVRFFWRDKGDAYEVSVLDMERYIATIKDEL